MIDEGELSRLIRQAAWKAHMLFKDDNFDGKPVRLVSLLFCPESAPDWLQGKRVIHLGLVLSGYDGDAQDAFDDLADSLKAGHGPPNRGGQRDALDPVALTWSKSPDFYDPDFSMEHAAVE